jgi:serine/threonine-protein kinase
LAIPLFQKAMRIDPHSPLPKAGLVEALVLKYKQTNNDVWLTNAAQELQAAEALNPDSAAVLIAAGRLHLTRENYEGALKSYSRVAERQPRNVEVLLRIAEVYQLKGLRKEAIESYQKAIALDPGYYETYQELGVFYDMRGEYAQAAEQFRKVIERAPRFSNAYTNLGAALNKMGQDDAAVQALLTSLNIKESAGALNSLAAIKAYQKRDDEAIVYYKRAFRLDQSSYICLLNLGDSCRREGREAESRDYYQRGSELALEALGHNPGNGSTRAFVGYLSARLGDRRRGQQEIAQALQSAPNDQRVIRRAVLTYEMLGQRDRALAVAETATAEALRELDRHPDLADFRQDPRFRELKARKEREARPS